MRKSTKMVKKLACLFLVVLMSIESFAAVVGDSDGAAFVTKAEFETLKSNLSKQVDKYNDSLNSKIDGAISNYLKGQELAQTVLPKNNLATLQKNYNVYWSGQTGGLQTNRVKYGSYYEMQVGSRGAAYGKDYVRQAKVTSTIDGEFNNFPIITKETETKDGVTTTRYVIGSWEERKPWMTYVGFFIYNGDDYHAWMGTNKKGCFYTQNFNPNDNIIFVRQDQWWRPSNGYPTLSYNWAMSIWGIYSTKVQNKDTKSIFIYPNAGSTYCWNESDKTKSSGTYDSEWTAIPNATNAGGWIGAGQGTYYNGTIPLTGYTNQDRATFPWCHTQYQYKDLYDDRLRTITGATKPISDGLLLTSEAGPGTLLIKGQGTNSGNLTIIIKDEKNENVKKTQTETIATTEKTFTVDLNSLPEKEAFNVWIKYTPTAKSTLTINNIIFKRLYYAN